MILALSFLVPDAIVSTPYSVDYIETVERITDSAYAIMGQSVGVNEPRDFGLRTGILNQLKPIRNNSGSTGK